MLLLLLFVVEDVDGDGDDDDVYVANYMFMHVINFLIYVTNQLLHCVLINGSAIINYSANSY